MLSRSTGHTYSRSVAPCSRSRYFDVERGDIPSCGDVLVSVQTAVTCRRAVASCCSTVRHPAYRCGSTVLMLRKQWKQYYETRLYAGCRQEQTSYIPACVPAAWRRRLWPALASVDTHSATVTHSHGRSVFEALAHQFEMMPGDNAMKVQLYKDLERTILPEQRTVLNTKVGLLSLERVVGAVAVYYPRTGYCQSMCLVAAHILICLCAGAWRWPGGDSNHPGGKHGFGAAVSELQRNDDADERREADARVALTPQVLEHAFWLLCHFAERIVPLYWAQPKLVGLLHHTDLLDDLCKALLPATMSHFQDVPMALVGVKWLCPMFARLCHLGRCTAFGINCYR